MGKRVHLLDLPEKSGQVRKDPLFQYIIVVRWTTKSSRYTFNGIYVVIT